MICDLRREKDVTFVTCKAYLDSIRAFASNHFLAVLLFGHDHHDISGLAFVVYGKNGNLGAASAFKGDSLDMSNDNCQRGMAGSSRT